MTEPENSDLPATTPKSQEKQVKTLEDVLREKVPEVLEDIPQKQRLKLAEIRIVQEEISVRSVRVAPLPEPSELAAYNSIIPNGADRIMKMAESQSAHRIKIEGIVVQSQQDQSFRGQLFGLIIGLSGLFLATYAAVKGQPWFGGTIGSATLVGLVSAFLYSKQQDKQELEQKRQIMSPPPITEKGETTSKS